MTPIIGQEAAISLVLLKRLLCATAAPVAYCQSGSELIQRTRLRTDMCLQRSGVRHAWKLLLSTGTALSRNKSGDICERKTKHSEIVCARFDGPALNLMHAAHKPWGAHPIRRLPPHPALTGQIVTSDTPIPDSRWQSSPIAA